MHKLSFLFVLCSLICAAPWAGAQSENNPPPLRRVTLYKHGVGYFERQGKVSGDGQVTFRFDQAQMNDVLKSLVVLDLGRGNERGKVSAVTFDSTKPIDKRLEEFGLSLDGSNSVGLTSLLGQLKGARVEVRLGAAAVAPITGTILGIEKHARLQNGAKTETQELILVSDSGELRSVALDQIRGIRLLDAKLREDLDQYLSILQSTIHKSARKLSIKTDGQGERDLFISYVVEAPVWKTTYRIVLAAQEKPFLQGWAVVDNVQDEDWTNVTLSLVAGAPVSFIQDLQQPRYKSRPVVGLPEEITVAPQVTEAALTSATISLVSSSRGGTLEGAVTDQNGAFIAGATIKIIQAGTGAQITATTNSDGRYRVRGLPQGRYSLIAEQSGFQTTRLSGLNVVAGSSANNDLEMRVGNVSEVVTITGSVPTLSTEASSISVVNAMKSKNSGVDIHVDTQEIGELFEYRIAHPVTIKRNSSALIPIPQNQIEGEAVSLYNRTTRAQNPMNALYLHNTSGLTLESGPLTVIENDTYAGEALTGRIKPGERRFITYAVDLGCRVSVKEDDDNEKAYLVEIINGAFRVHYRQTKATVYTLSNATARAKTVYLEHLYDKNADWKLSKTAKPIETSEQYYRFKVTVPPGSATQFAVNEELPEINTFALSNITPDNIAVFVKSNYLTPAMKQALESIIDLKAQLAALTRSIGEKQVEIGQIAKDQERMRENLRALGKTEEEKQLVQRYVAKLAQGEDQLERLRQEEKKLQEDRNARQRQLDERIRKIAMEHPVG